MPWVIRDVVDDINKAVGRRWQGLDPLLPEPGDLPEGCMPPLVVNGANGRPAGLGVCHHQHVPADTLNQTWGTAARYSLIPRLRDPALDDLLGQWRDHLAGLPEASAEDTAAMINWPARDVSGVNALLRRGMQPLTVIAVRPAGHAPAPAAVEDEAAGLVIREARPEDLDAVTKLEMGVIRYDAQFGAAIIRPATEALVHAETQAALARRPAWAWLAERPGRDGRPVGLVHVQPPEDSGWIAGMTRPGVTVYLQTMFVRPGERGGGVGAALVRHAHEVLDARGVETTLLHYAQMNPLSAPFWNRMGYRPLWTGWEVRPAAVLR